jgi:3-hydroxyisobutyrate dehydrogenase
VAVIGLGLMGTALAEALIREGFDVRGFDLNPERRDALDGSGGRAFDSSIAAAEGLGLVVTSLPTGEQVREVCIGPEGIASHLAPEAVVIDTTTSSSEDTVDTAGRLAAVDIGFVDACISGSSNMVADHDVVIMVGGASEHVARSMPVLDSIARSVHHVGPVGSGATTKLVVNLVLGAQRLALAEGLTLAARSGLDPEVALEVLRDGVAYSKVMDIWGPRMLAGGIDPPTSRLRQHHKDVRLMLEQGARVGAPLPLTTALNQVLNEAERLELSDADISGLIEVLRRIAEEREG